MEKTTIKQKLSDNTENERQLTYQTIAHSLSNPSSIPMENFDQSIHEISVDSYESTSQHALALPPTKSSHHNDESISSSSIDINSPPAKPPRHFLYNNEDLIKQTDSIVKQVVDLVDISYNTKQDDENNHSNITTITSFNTNQIERLNGLKSVETCPVQSTHIVMASEIPLTIKSLDKSMMITSSPSFSSCIEQLTNTKESSDEIIPIEIVQLARELSTTILQDVEKQTNWHSITNNDQRTSYDKLSQLDQQLTFHNNISSFSQSFASNNNLSTQTTSHSLICHSSTDTISSIVNSITTKTVPVFTTPIKVTCSSSITHSTIINVTNSNEQISTLNSNLTSILLKSDTKWNSLDCYDNPLDSTTVLPQTTKCRTSTYSFLSDYDNFPDSCGSLNDDQQQTIILLPTDFSYLSSLEMISSTVSSSITTIYESFDNFPLTSSSMTSPTYVSASSTFNTDNTTTPQYLHSDMSDEEFMHSFDIPNLTPGRNYQIATKKKKNLCHARTYSYISLACSPCFFSFAKWHDISKFISQHFSFKIHNIVSMLRIEIIDDSDEPD